MKSGTAIDGRKILRFSNGLQMRLKDIKVGLCLILMAIALGVVSLNTGAIKTGTGDFWRLLFGIIPDDDRLYALWTVRLPHIILGFLVGWCVALTGAMLQSVARNPLADPGLFGMSQGSITVIILLLVFMPSASGILVIFAALGGGLAVAMLLIWLVGNERSSGLAMLLMGIAVATILSSVDSFLILYMPAEISYSLSSWMAGSLFQASWSLIATFIPLFLLSLAGIFLAGRALNLYELGHEFAMALGEPVKYSRPFLLVFAVFLNSAAVTAVGPLTFLGILAPHLAGFLSSATGRARLFLSALVGGNLVIAADILTKTGGWNVPLPLGLSLILIGVPLFIVVLRLRALHKFQTP